MKRQLTLLAFLAALLLPLGAAAQISSFPYSCDFEGETTDWNIVNGSNGWYIGEATNNGGSKSLYISNNNGTSNAYGINTTSVSWAWIELQASAGDYYLSFDWKGYGENINHDYLRVFAVPHGYTYTANTLPGTTSEYTFLSMTPEGWVDICHRLNLQNNWQHSDSIFSIPTTGAWDLVFMWTNDGSVGTNPPAAVDNVTLSQLTCSAPTAIVVSDITTTEATVEWTSTGEESQWLVYMDGEFMGLATTPSYSFSGLTSSSSHVVAVRALCGAGDTSFAASTTFRTACDVVNLPWSDGFEDYATGNGNRPDCWTVLQEYVSGSSHYPYTYNYGSSNGKVLYMYSSSASSPNLIVTPELNAAPNQIHAVFSVNASMYGTPTFEAGVMTDTTDMSTFRTLVTFNGNGGTWTEYEFFSDTVSLTGSSCYVAFRWTNSSGYTAYLDNVAVEVSSDCRRPETAQASQPTYDGAYVSWTDNGTAATAYTVRVCTTNNAESADAVDFTATASPYQVTGLSSNTTYYAWVATNCGGTQTMWRAAGSFTTQRDCYPVQNLALSDVNQNSAAITWNYQSGMGREATGVSLRVIDQSATPPDTTFEDATGTAHFLTGLTGGHTYNITATTECDGDFEAYTTTSLTIETPSCGQIQGTNTSGLVPFATNYNYSYCQIIYPASQLQGLSTISGIKFRQSSSTTTQPNRFLSVWIGNTTQSTVDSTNYISVDDMTQVANNAMFNVTTSGWKTINFSEEFTWDGTSNIVVAVVNNTGAYSSFNFGVHSANEGNVAYWYRDGSVAVDPADPNARQTGANAINYNTSTSIVPDITFIGECELPTCLAPIAAFGSSTENSITVDWVAGNAEAQWTVEYRLYGDTVWTTAVASTTQTSATISDLETSTLYQVRVGSLCSDGTLYSATVQGRTQCGTISLPYTETFEGWNTTEFPACWYKVQSYNNYPYIGSSSLHDGTRCMYAYYSGTQTCMFASPEVPTDADNIKVTFWTQNGYATPTNSRLKVGVLTNPNDPNSFVECIAAATGNTSGSWTEWEFYTDNVVSSTPVHIAFQFLLNSTTSYGYVDDVTISQAGTCRRPNTPSRDNISYYSADLHWNDVNQGAATYEVRYSTVNNPEADGYQTTTSTSGDVSLNGLHNGTTYYAWVRPQCNTELEWLTIPSFTTQVSCYAVTGATLDSKTYTTAAIRWNYSDNGMTAQGVLLGLYDRTDSNMVEEDVYATGTNHIFTGLTSGHNYTVYFSTVCDPDTSAATTMQFSLDEPSCGEQSGTSSCSYVPFYGNYKYGYTQSIYPASLFATNDTLYGISYSVKSVPSQYLTRPVDLYIGAAGGRTSLDTNNYMPIDSLMQVADSFLLDVSHTGWTTIMFDTPFPIPAGEDIIIAVCNRTGQYKDFTWNGISTTSSSNYISVYWYRDGSYISPANPGAGGPSRAKTASQPIIQVHGNCDLSNLCTAPVLMITGATTNEVSLQWAADNCTEFTVEYRASGDTAWTVAATSLTATADTIEGLDASTLYEFRVGSECSAGSTLYSTVKSTYTDCEAEPVPVTFTFAQALTPCWKLTNSNVYRSTDNGTNVLYWYYTSYGIGTAVLPEVNQPINTLMAVINARYGYYNGGAHNMLVGVGNADGTGITWIDTIDLSNQYTDYYVYFDSYTGTGDRIVISKEGGNYLYVQSIAIGVDNGCHPMSSFSFTSSTAHTATLSLGHASATSFELQYRLNSDETWQSEVVSGTTATISNLQASSAYVARVRAICGEGDSSVWSQTVTFYTACEAVDMPWSENFDAMTSFTGSCWFGMSGEAYSDAPSASFGSSVPWGINSSYGDYITVDGKAMTMNLYSTNRYWALTPEINVTTNSAVLSFDIAFSRWNTYSTSTPAYDNDDRFVVAITTDGGNTFAPLYQVGSDDTRDDVSFADLGTDYATVEVPVVGYNGQNVRIAIYGGSMASGGDGRIVIDNLSLTEGEPLAPCDAPTGLAATATTTTATVSYSGSAASYEVAIVSGAWTAPTAGTAESGLSHTFSGLSEGTQYTIGVRSICADGNKSEWATVTVTTDVTPDPGCPAPTAVSATNVDNTSASINWTENGTATQWQIEVSTGDQVVSTTDASAKPHTLTGLTKNTTYSVRVRSVCSSESSSNWSSAATFTTTNVGIEGIEAEAISIYPNPATTTVTIEGVKAGAQLSIIDLNGREVYSDEIRNSKFEISVATLAKGAYFVRIVSTEGIVVRKLVVK